MENKVGPFIIACLNCRINATLYIGVVDNKTEKFCHGEIVGLRLDPDAKALMQEALENCFTGPHPKLLAGVPKNHVEVVQECVKPLQFIPVTSRGQSHDEDFRWVVEMDIEPSSRLCNNIIFKMSTMKKGPRKLQEKKDIQELKMVSFCREGSSTVKYQLDDPEFVDKILGPHGSVSRREHDEREASERTEKKLRPLEELKLLLSRGRSPCFPNPRGHYFLVRNLEEEDENDFAWLEYIPWIINFNVATSSVSEKGMNMENNFYNFRSNGHTFPCQPSSNMPWSTIWPEVSRTLEHCMSAIRDDESLEDVVVLALLQNTNYQEEVADILKEFSKHVALDQIVCAFGDSNPKRVNREMERHHHGFSWRKQVVQVNFAHVQQAMLSCCDAREDHILLPSSSGLVPFRKEDIGRLSKDDLLTVVPPPRDIADDPKTNSTSARRTLTQSIVDAAHEIAKKDHPDSHVARISLVHQPGAGGTTVARQVMEQLCGEMRCVKVEKSALLSDGGTATAKKIVSFKNYGEDNRLVLISM